MQLSQNFTLRELTKSQTAERKGIPNEPNEDQVDNIIELCDKILQPVRDEFGPVTVTSGYRSPELCVAIGSSINSQHAKGEAADFEVAGVSNMVVAQWIADNLDFDQLILECYTGGNTGWIHCSYTLSPRNEKLTYDKANGYRHGLIDG
jgi:hypothetical protein